jgi:putative transposase
MQLYSQYSVGFYCKLFGKSRQAFYEQQKKNTDDRGLQDTLVLKLVAEIRKDLPRCGTDKLHFMLKDSFSAHRIKLGRDGLYALLGEHGLLIRHRNRRPYTTNSNHHYRKYPNLIRELMIDRAGQLWVSDITYLRVGGGFGYLSIITDAYSHKVVGYKLHPTLHSQGAVDALLMGAKDVKRTDGLIHHSDRGVQYCCHEYVTMIQHLGIGLSMTEKGDPYENPVAERINGILKQEQGLGATFADFDSAAQAVDKAVKKYNEMRIHDSCGRLTPVAAHEQQGVLRRYWKPKVYRKRLPVEDEPV